MGTNAVVLVALYSDQTANLFGQQAYEGTWSLSGDIVTIVFPSISGSTYQMTGTVNGDIVTDGTYLIDGNPGNCWRAQRETVKSEDPFDLQELSGSL